MAWTTPRDWSATELVTAAMMNTHVRDNLRYLHGDTSDIVVNNNFTATGYLAATAQIYSKFGDANQIQLGTDGKLYFGNGLDTNLYRSAENVLKTDDSFYVGGGYLYLDSITEMRLDPSDTTRKIYFGAAQDTNLYRSGADTLRTDDNFTASGYIWSSIQVYANYGTATQIQLAGDGKVYFGSGLDTNLYRSGADSLKTDDNFEAVGYIVSGGMRAHRHPFGQNRHIESSSVVLTEAGVGASSSVTFTDAYGGANVIIGSPSLNAKVAASSINGSGFTAELSATVNGSYQICWIAEGYE